MTKKKITSPVEYRKKSRKILELPSGAVFEIRKLSPLTYASVLEQIGIKPGNINEDSVADAVRDKYIAVMQLVIPKCVIRPTIVIEETKDDDKLTFSDLEMNDVMDLMEKIYEFSGLSAEDTEEREEFLEE